MNKDIDFVVERLGETPIFRALPPAELEKLAGSVEIVYLNAGSTLAEQGDEADCAYLLVSGRLRAFARQGDGTESAVGEVAAGELVGEMALLSSTPRSATVRAVRDSQLLMVRNDLFDQITRNRPEATLEMARVLVNRLERANRGRQMAPPRRAIALVPVFGDAASSIEALVKTIAEFGSTEVVDETRVTAALGTDHSEADLVHWLHRLEAAANLVLYLADSVDSKWGRRCLRQADHIVAVDAAPGRSSNDRTIDTLEALTVGAVGPTVDAVCVHPADASRPSGGARWQRNRSIRVHHIRRGSDRDHGRVARSMIRRDIAMVLSGGGARGMAHVGVLRAFEEASIPIDVIGGTSFGAIIAVLRAMDHSWREIRDILWDNLASVGAPIDVTPPALAISKGQRLIRLLGSTIGDAHLEDVWLRCFCVSSNLSSGHPLVHTSGSAATALRASVAIPGVFPPVASGDGEVLVDGAVMNNLPVDVMAGFSSGGPIIAVNLRAPAQLTAGELPEDGVVSGWRMLGRRLNPLQQKVRVPSLVEILTRASEVGGAEAARALEQSADFVLHPPTGDHALLDFSALDDLITSGYEHTVSRLEAWQEAGRPLTAR